MSSGNYTIHTSSLYDPQQTYVVLGHEELFYLNVFNVSVFTASGFAVFMMQNNNNLNNSAGAFFLASFVCSIIAFIVIALAMSKISWWGVHGYASTYDRARR